MEKEAQRSVSLRTNRRGEQSNQNTHSNGKKFFFFLFLEGEKKREADLKRKT